MIRFLKIKNYTGKGIKKGFLSLLLSKSIIRIAGGLLGVFVPIFLFKYFNENIEWVVGWYVAGSALYVVSLGAGAILMSKIGWRKSLRFGSIFGALFFVSFYLSDKMSVDIFIISSLFFLTIHRVFHWIPYHVDFVKFTDKNSLGKEIGVLGAITSIIGVVSPMIAGFILSEFNFTVLFAIAIAVYLISIVPLYFIPKTHEKFSWGYIETWKHLFDRNKRMLLVGRFADGAEQAVGLVIWPIFIFKILNESYLQMGAMVTLITGVMIILQLLVGKYSDDKNMRRKFLKFGSVLYSLGWIFKVFVATAFHIFVIDTYHRFIKIFTRTSIDVFAYEVAADGGHFVDEITVLEEIAVHAGKIAMLLVVALLLLFFSINLSFILAAIASIFINFIQKDLSIHEHRLKIGTQYVYKKI